VADDHPAVLTAVAELLSQHFDVVSTVSAGQAALDDAIRLAPDLLVLDIGMPGMDGLQCASQIAASGVPSRIVFLSSYDSDECILEAFSRGASGYVQKSRMGRDLLPAVHEVLEGRQFVPSTSVLPQWWRAAGHRHDLQFFASDDSLTASVASYFEHGLQAGHAIVAVASAAHRQALDAELKHRSINASALADEGRYCVFDSRSALDAILDHGVPNALKFEEALGPLTDLPRTAGTPTRVTMFGEVAPILWAEGHLEAALEVERIADRFAAARPMSLLCMYPCTDDLAQARQTMSRVCAEHHAIVPH
jgi:CheY-like chemotaxis protein